MTRKINKVGLDIIKKFEGFNSSVYICAGGYKTIGYGHKIEANEKFSTITEEEAEKLLQKDLERAEKGVCQYIRPGISDNQFSALVSFAFNLGNAALQRSCLRQKINYGSNAEDILYEFRKWVYAGGKKLLGLLRRREAEASLFLSS